jgi:hypothetical protein
MRSSPKGALNLNVQTNVELEAASMANLMFGMKLKVMNTDTVNFESSKTIWVVL